MWRFRDVGFGILMVVQLLFQQSAYRWSWNVQRHLHQVPKQWFCQPAWGYRNYPAHLRLKFLYNLGQQGGGRESVSNHVFPWDVEGIYCPSLRVRNRRDIGRKFLVQAGSEQIHLGTVPKFGNLFEDLWKKGPLR